MRQTIFNYTVYPYGQSCLFMCLTNHPAYGQSTLSLEEVVESNCGEESSAVNFRKENSITSYSCRGKWLIPFNIL